MFTRHATLAAALFLAGSLGPMLAGVLTERWVVETQGDSRAVLGPTRMEICGEGACRRVVYTRSIAELRVRRARAEDAVEREWLQSALERMEYSRTKGLQILVPGLVIAGLLGAFALLLLWRLGSGISNWTRSTIRFVTCGLALGLVAFALVFAEGMSYLPADDAQSRWGSSFYLALTGSALALVGGILSGFGPREEPAPPADAPPAAA